MKLKIVDINEIIKSCNEPLIGCKCLKRIDAFNNFLCNACNIQFHANMLISHMVSAKHRTKYMQNYYMHHYTTLFHSHLPSDERNIFIHQLSLQIEEEEGRQLAPDIDPYLNEKDIKEEPEKKKLKLSITNEKKMNTSKIFSQLLRSNQILKSLGPMVSDIPDKDVQRDLSETITINDKRSICSNFSTSSPVLQKISDFRATGYRLMSNSEQNPSLGNNDLSSDSQIELKSLFSSQKPGIIGKKTSRFSNYLTDTTLEKSEIARNNFSIHSQNDETYNNLPTKSSEINSEIKRSRFSNVPQSVENTEDQNKRNEFSYSKRNRNDDYPEIIEEKDYESKKNYYSSISETNELDLMALKENIKEIFEPTEDESTIARSNFDEDQQQNWQNSQMQPKDQNEDLDVQFYPSYFLNNDDPIKHKELLSNEKLNIEPHRSLLPTPEELPLLKYSDTDSAINNLPINSSQKSSKTLLPSPKSLLPLPYPPASSTANKPLLPSPSLFLMEFNKQYNNDKKIKNPALLPLPEYNDDKDQLDKKIKNPALLPLPANNVDRDQFDKSTRNPALLPLPDQCDFKNRGIEIPRRDLSPSAHDLVGIDGIRIPNAGSLPTKIGSNGNNKNNLLQNSDVSCTSEQNSRFTSLPDPLNIDIYNRLPKTTNLDRLNFIRSSVKNFVQPKVIYSNDANNDNNLARSLKMAINKNRIMNLQSSDMFSKYLNKSIDVSSDASNELSNSDVGDMIDRKDTEAYKFNSGDSVIGLKNLNGGVLQKNDVGKLPEKNVELVLEKKAAADNRHYKVSEMSLDLQMTLQKYRSKKNNCKFDF